MGQQVGETTKSKEVSEACVEPMCVYELRILALTGTQE